MNRHTVFKTVCPGGLMVMFAFLTTCADARADGFYVSDQLGIINQVTSAGVVSTYATFPGSSDIPEGLALTPDGTLFIANGGDGQLLKIPANGSIENWTSIPNEFTFGLALGADSNLFAAVEGLAFGQIDKISQSGTVSTFAQLPTGAEPYGLAFDSKGNLFVSDSDGLHHDVYLVTPGGSASVFATLPQGGSLMGLAIGPGGYLFVANFDGIIYDISPGGVVNTYATLPSNAGLTGLEFDNNGNLYASENRLNEIVEISPGGGAISDFASLTAPGFMLATPEPNTTTFLGLALLILAMRKFPLKRDCES